LLLLIHFAIVFIIATVLGLFIRWLIQNKNIFVDFQSPWLEAFPKKKLNYARALLDNDYYIVGDVEWIQTDIDSLTSGNRDILFVNPEIIDQNGSLLNARNSKERVVINTHNVKILELTADMSKKKWRVVSWLKSMIQKSKARK